MARAAALLGLLFLACTKPNPGSTPGSASLSGQGGEPPAGPAILLVTLDTTRADIFDLPPEAIRLPTFRKLDEHGLFFSQAYSTAPTTGPAHASILTGLYPAGHGLHENGRTLSRSLPRIAELLGSNGVRTAAFVSAYPLASRFGWGQGFQLYDDIFGQGAVERSAEDTTDRAVRYLEGLGPGPSLTWVHYFDPHEPYDPPEPFRSRYPDDPYRAEIAALDPQLARLLHAFEASNPDARHRRILIVGDHGEGLGDHGEELHGNLLYQEVMRVPLWILAPGVEPGRMETPVSIRSVFGTLAGWAGLDGPPGLLADPESIVMAEAMKPFLHYGWQPQVMAVEGSRKVISDGEFQLYDVLEDPLEQHDLSADSTLPASLLEAVRSYPIPDPQTSYAQALDAEARSALATLGYVTQESNAPPRPDAPRPIEMVDIFSDLDRSSGWFVREQYQRVIPLSEKILARDPANLMVRLRLAVSYSLLGDEKRADTAFRRAEKLAPDSTDLLYYRTMHALRFGRDGQAEPWLDELLARTPERVPALQAMARLRERQGRPADAADLLSRALAVVGQDAEISGRLGNLWMQLGATDLAINAFEDERLAAGSGFRHAIELGVCYLAVGRLDEAATVLDEVVTGHPGHAMALFKRAQVSVLLGEADREARIRRAWAEADRTTRALIESEALFQGVSLK